MEQLVAKNHDADSKVAAAFREQSYLWRAIALLQIPTTLTAIIVALVVYVNADTIVEVSPRPAPGFYLAREIPDEEFVKVGIDFVNLISSYQPAIAERQFNYARNFLMEPIYSSFSNRFLVSAPGIQPEIEQIRQIQRAQMFFINRDLITIRRLDDREDPRNSTVEVRIPGELIKFLNGVKQDQVKDKYLVYFVQMRTFPKTTFNQNGIFITDFILKTQIDDGVNQNLYEDLKRADSREETKAKKRKRPTAFNRYKWQ